MEVFNQPHKMKQKKSKYLPTTKRLVHVGTCIVGQHSLKNGGCG